MDFCLNQQKENKERDKSRDIKGGEGKSETEAGGKEEQSSHTDKPSSTDWFIYKFAVEK